MIMLYCRFVKKGGKNDKEDRNKKNQMIKYHSYPVVPCTIVPVRFEDQVAVASVTAGLEEMEQNNRSLQPTF